MKYFNLISIVLLFYVFISCAPARKQTFLQEVNRRNVPAVGISFIEKKADHKLEPGDVVSIQVSSLTPANFDFFTGVNEFDSRVDPALTGYLLDGEGNIVLPQIGAVSLKGLTIAEAQNTIKTILTDYLDSPTVYVRLVSFKFTVIGEVSRPGQFSIYNNRVNILEALGMSGGLTEYANFEQVKLLRSRLGVSKLIYVNLLDANLPESDEYYLQPNDIVIVDQLKNKNFRRNSASNVTLFLSGIATIATVILAFDRL